MKSSTLSLALITAAMFFMAISTYPSQRSAAPAVSTASESIPVYRVEPTYIEVSGVGRVRRGGSMLYMVDDDGHDISDGYHSFEKRDYGIVGQVGAIEYLIGTDGKRKSDGFHSFTPTDYGLKAEIGAKVHRLDREGKYLDPEESGSTFKSNE